MLMVFPRFRYAVTLSTRAVTTISLNVMFMFRYPLFMCSNSGQQLLLRMSLLLGNWKFSLFGRVRVEHTNMHTHILHNLCCLVH